MSDVIQSEPQKLIMTDFNSNSGAEEEPAIKFDTRQIANTLTLILGA